MRYILITLAFLLALNAHAHESRPLHIDISETQQHIFVLNWKTPPSVDQRNTPEVLLPGCTATAAPVVMNAGGGLVKKQQLLCPEGLSQLAIKYPQYNPSVSALVRVQLFSGQQHTKLLSPEQSLWDVPARESKAGVAADYTRLGITHIWAGIDHLLFLVCLLLIAGTGKRILITITGFTVAHSITLLLSALKWVTVPVAPVEAVIAVSIVFLATEIAKGQRDTLTWKYPISVSSSFGLLHGFGFAAVLNDIGLPQTELMTGLLFFNIGVEIGQIVFVLAVLALIKVLLQFKFDINQPLVEKPAAYVVGILASYWMLERATVMLVS